MSDKRFEGETKGWNCEHNFGSISYEDRGRRKNIFYSSHNIHPDWRGSRAWAFDKRIPVSFTILRKSDKKHAGDVTPIFPLSEPEDLAGYRETSELVSKTYDYGFLKRACGDSLFIHQVDVVEQHKDRWSFLEIGSPVYHGARFDEATSRWRADYIELYSFDELQSFKEQEQEPQIEAEPVLALAPENRSKSFRQLALEKRLGHELPAKNKNQP